MRKLALLLPAVLAVGLLAAAPAADQAGSSESETVQRSCGAPASDQYDPPSGAGQTECRDANGNFDPNRTYTANHWTNDVSCGTEDELPSGAHGATGVSVSGDGGQEGNGGGGWIQVCSDGDLPIQGRVTFEGSAGASGGDGSLTADGDRDNEVEQLQGWATVDLGDQAVGCGKSYDEGGRADAANPTSDEPDQANCG